MIKLEITQIHNNKPYYKITKNTRKIKKTCYAFGKEQAYKLIESIRRVNENIETSGLEKVSKEHKELLNKLKL